MAVTHERAASSDVAEERSVAIGILAMLLGMACLVANDTLVKLVSDTHPTGQIIAVRGAFASLLVAVLVVRTCGFGDMARLARPSVFARTAGEVGATAFFLTALFQMPIGNVTAIMQFVPLGVTAGAALFLGDPVGWRRWLATAVGFTGVIMIVQPGTDAFTVGAVFALVAVAFVILRDLSTRQIASDVPTNLLTLFTAIPVMLLGLAMGLFETWMPLTSQDLLFLFLAAAFLTVAYAMVIIAVRRVAPAIIAPYRYSLVLWALLSGYLIWGEIPNTLASLGIAVVVGAGLYAFWREQKVKKIARAHNGANRFTGASHDN